MKQWQTLQRVQILNHSKFLQVEAHTVALPNGAIIADWPWLITPDFVNIVACTPDQRILCFRQTKYAASRVALAPVGGYLEPGEDALTAGQRELLEETGYTASEWLDLGRYAVDGNRGAGTAYLYLARNAQPVARPTADDLEEQELLLLTPADIRAALAAGEVQILPWAAAFGLALLYLADAP
ncbi:MAG: NUDIX hydrolase [Chloroflexaceae bacterium]|nr:NUDIX hydrolase [Chloroflexaceae bacterium]